MNTYKDKYLKYKNKYLALKYGDVNLGKASNSISRFASNIEINKPNTMEGSINIKTVGGSTELKFDNKSNLDRYIHTYLFDYHKEKKDGVDFKDKIQTKTTEIVKKIQTSDYKSYINIINDTQKSDFDKGKELVKLYYSLLNEYDKKVDEMDLEKYKIEYYLYSFLKEQDKGNSRKNASPYQVFSSEIKHYSNIFSQSEFDFEYGKQKQIIINSNENPYTKGRQLLNLIQTSQVDTINMRQLQMGQVTKEGKFMCTTPCKYNTYKKNIFGIPYESKKCECTINDGSKQECNVENCERKNS